MHALQERASHAMLRQENKQRAASELVRVKALHVDQCHELQVQLERLRGEKEGTGKELEHLRAALKGTVILNHLIIALFH